MSVGDQLMFAAVTLAALAWAGWLWSQAWRGGRPRTPARRVGMTGGGLLLMLFAWVSIVVLSDGDRTTASSPAYLVPELGLLVVYPLIGVAIVATMGWTTHLQRRVDQRRGLRLTYGRTLLQVAVSRWTYPYLIGLTVVVLVGTLYVGIAENFTLHLGGVLAMLWVLRLFPVVLLLFFALCPRRLLQRWATE